MLNRADRALLMAKQTGRNAVVQLGGGMVDEPLELRRSWWFWPKDRAGPLVDRCMVTNVPLNLTMEKLRGFVSDHHAPILNIEGGRVDIAIHSGKTEKGRRRSDRPLPMTVELSFAQEERAEEPGPADEKSNNNRTLQTRIRVVLRPRRGRDR